jgi:hypothetical protein
MIVAARLGLHPLAHGLDPALAAEVDLTDQIVPDPVLVADLLVDEGSVQALGDSAIGGEVLEQLIAGQPRRGRLISGMSAITAPAVLLGPLDDAGANGIESDVANDGEQLGLFLDQMPVEPTLEQVSVTLVSLVEPLRVAPARATACPGRRSAPGCR